MIRTFARRLRRRSLAAREKARGIRTDVPLPFDMFDETRTAEEARRARKLEGIYHKGQQKVWDGRKTLSELLERHGGVRLPTEQRQAIQGLFAVILWGELAAWKISADLALQLEPLEAKMAATSQAHDEARHFYVMHDYLHHVGEVPKALGPRTRQVLEGTLCADSLVKKLIGMQMMIEPMALTLFQIVRERQVEPVLTDLLEYYERDEARHVALGVLHLPKLLKGMTLREATDLWSWMFGEFWGQFAMMRELEPHFQALGIDPREVVRVGRAKQVRANQMMMEELGYELPVFELFMRFFDGKAEWDFPTGVDRKRYAARLVGAVKATTRGLGVVPEDLTNVAA